MYKIILSFVCVLFLANCSSTKVVDIKSPCVGGFGSVCERLPINTWMANNRSVSS